MRNGYISRDGADTYIAITLVHTDIYVSDRKEH
jgi:hypothetical protein